MDTVPGGVERLPAGLRDEAHAIAVQNGKQRVGRPGDSGKSCDARGVWHIGFRLIEHGCTGWTGYTASRFRFGNADEPRIDTNRDGPPSMTNRARMYLRYRDLDTPTTWEGTPPGARASRPQPYSCNQPAIQGHSLEQCTKPAFAGFQCSALFVFLCLLWPSPAKVTLPNFAKGSSLRRLVLHFGSPAFAAAAYAARHP